MFGATNLCATLELRGMGSYVTAPEWESDEVSIEPEDSPPLGTLLSGRFSTLEIDSVEAVRDERRRE